MGERLTVRIQRENILMASYSDLDGGVRLETKINTSLITG